MQQNVGVENEVFAILIGHGLLREGQRGFPPYGIDGITDAMDVASGKVCGYCGGTMTHSPRNTLSVDHVSQALEAIAPLELAEEWDNVGLLLGSPDDGVSRILLTIDLTEPVLDEAIARGATMVIAYHPPIFAPLKRLTDACANERIMLRAARAGIAIHSPHTALDAANDGLGDWLVRGCGDGDVRALLPHASLPASESCKLVTFCPADAVAGIRDAWTATGAGRIGDYVMCSFETPGTGTFFGAEGTNPTTGKMGIMNRVDEVRLEMVCPSRSLGLAMIALRQAHPYEEPPVEIHRLEKRPRRDRGTGRLLMLDRAASLDDIILRVKRRLGVTVLRVAEGANRPDQHTRIGAVPGAGGSLIDAAMEQNCDLYLTGEMRHHDVVAAQARGCTLLLPGHTNTERGYLPVLRERLCESLGEHLKDDQIFIANEDRSPFRVA